MKKADKRGQLKEILHVFLFPPLWVVILASLTGFPFVIFALTCLSETSPVSYISYVLSAYATMVLVLAFPELKSKITYRFRHNPIVDKISSHPIGNRYLNDLTFKGSISLHQGMIINLFYAGFKFVTSIIYGSVWLGAIAVYYVMLCVLRFHLILNSRKAAKLNNRKVKSIHEFRSYRKTGFLMFLLNAAMGGMVIQMIWKNEGYEYPGYVIYISAMYTFCSFISAIMNLVKFRKAGSPILSASRAISFAGALMSVLALQTAMISRFGGGDEQFRMEMNIITGAFVLGITLFVAVYLIVHGQRALNKLKRRQTI